MYEFIAELCLGMLLSKHATTCLHAPYAMTHYHCKFGIDWIPQVSNACIL